MIKKLINKLEIIKEFNSIKKQYRIAKRHKSCKELENVKFELMDFQAKLINLNKFSNNLSLEILHQFELIENARLKIIQVDRSLLRGYDI